MASGVAIASFVVKALVSVSVSKVVGKITGNDMVGMVAGMGAGALIGGAAGIAGDAVDAGTQASIDRSTAAFGAMGGEATTAAASLGSGLTGAEQAVGSFADIGSNANAGGATSNLLNVTQPTEGAGNIFDKVEGIADKYPKLLKLGSGLAQGFSAGKAREDEMEFMKSEREAREAEDIRSEQRKQARMDAPINVDSLEMDSQYRPTYSNPYEGRYSPLKTPRPLLRTRAQQLEEQANAAA